MVKLEPSLLYAVQNRRNGVISIFFGSVRMTAIVDSALGVYTVQVAKGENNMITSSICTLGDVDSDSERLNVSFDAVPIIIQESALIQVLIKL